MSDELTPLPPLRIPQLREPTSNLPPNASIPIENVEGLAQATTPDPEPPTAPNELHFNNGTVQIDIDATGITVTSLSSGDSVQITNSGGFIVTDGATGYELDITGGGLITHNMGIQTWAVCNSGTPASSLVLASAPF